MPLPITRRVAVHVPRAAQRVSHDRAMEAA